MIITKSPDTKAARAFFTMEIPKGGPWYRG